MIEKENIQFFDTPHLIETAAFPARCNLAYLQSELEKRFPDMKFRVTSATINNTGIYVAKESAWIRLFGGDNRIRNLPGYCEVTIDVCTGNHYQTIIVWSPKRWNDRFAGTAGGGTCTGGRTQINTPDNTQRGWNMGYALLNGFTCATTDSGNKGNCTKWGHERENLENWSYRGTHNMTIFGKAVAEILHGRPVKYSYMSGGSGGGRQALTEAQNFPEDYNGIWASCPAVNWTQCIVSGLWTIAVMNEYNHILSFHKMNAFRDEVHNSVGGKESYYQKREKVAFDPYTILGKKTKDGVISRKDCNIMNEIWKGAHTSDGRFLWYGFLPGGTFWNKIIPIGAFYYPLISKKPKCFSLVEQFASLAFDSADKDFRNIKLKDFEEIFDVCVKKLGWLSCDNADLRPFCNYGGKLIIDHGMDDPLIPVEGTINYYNRMRDICGGQAATDQFCRLYINPGDGHGNCFTNGPGLTESTGIRALMNWVENDVAPEELPAIQVNKKTGETINTGFTTSWRK